MAHGDEKGLKMPPRLAPIQAVIVPIFKTDDEKAAVMESVEALRAELADAGVRVHIDARDHQPGFKFNDWEMRGVPVRLELGPRDVQNGSVVAARRDQPGKEGKRTLTRSGIAEQVKLLLDDIQASMLAAAAAFRDANIIDVTSYDELRQVVEAGGFARGWWADSAVNERQIKEETGASHRCYPLEQPGGEGVCFYSGAKTNRVALFAKAY
jgi:prolyl-tRNA synthetase